MSIHFQAAMALIICCLLFVESHGESLTIGASPTTTVDLAEAAVKTDSAPPPVTDSAPPSVVPPPLRPSSPIPPGTLPPIPTPLPPTIPDPTPPPKGDIIDIWLNQTYLRYNLKSLLRNGDHIDQFSCGISRCGKQERRLENFDFGPKCFCDEDCVSQGDCCFDYKQSCQVKAQTLAEEHEPSSCKYKIPSAYYGVTVINSCSSRNHTSSSIVTRCTSWNESDILTLLPVLDLNSNKTYSSVFCASCNLKTNVTLWSVKASCQQTYKSNEKYSESERLKIMDIVTDSCTLRFYPPRNLQYRHRVCIPRLHSKHYKPINDSLSEEKLKEYCLSYAFPLCAITPDKGGSTWFKNPHCMLYQGINDFSDSFTSCPNHQPRPLPPLTLFFDFQETKTFAISSQLENETSANQIVKRHMNCPEGYGYDVFSGRCRVFYLIESIQPNISGNATNCTYIKLTDKEYTLFENGSLFYANKFMPDESFIKINQTIYVCTNLSTNYTVLATGRSPQSTFQRVLAWITVTGYSISICSLILLIITYIILPDLRNLPGKIILSLTTAMLVYIALYFFINRTDLHLVCHVIGVGLHFCLLSMFSWMNVMAFDIHYTFTRKGQSGDRNKGRTFFTGVYMKYALYAWCVPLLITSLSFCLEITNTFPIGYASGPYCFISNLYAKVYLLAIPVGVILIYNIIALCHTLINIRGVQKQATKVTNQKHRVDLPIVCVKMTSVMGITWVLGYVASFDGLTFLQYLHVILNSLQGFFIFISYVMNRRVFKMYRSYFETVRGKHSSVLSKRSTNITPTQ